MKRKVSPVVGVIIVLVVAAVAAFLIVHYTKAPEAKPKPAAAQQRGERRGQRARGGPGAAERPGPGGEKPGEKTEKPGEESKPEGP